MMTRLRTGAALAGVMCVVAAAPGLAHGQATPDQKKKAKEHYEKGTTHYNLGRFDEAVDEFTKAFELYPEPVFLYNIAQSYRMKENWERAKFFYKRYLSLSPDAKNRADVEARIAEMDAELAKAKSGPTTPVTPPTTGPTTPPTGPTTPPGTGPTTPPTNPTTTPTTSPGTDTAQTGSPGSDTSVGAVVPAGGEGSVLGEYRRDKPLRLAVTAGPAFVSLGNGPNVPVQAAFAIDAGYLFTRGKLGIGAGTSLGYTTVPWEVGAESGSAGLLNWGVVAQGAYAVARKLDVRLEAGVGVTWFTSLQEHNPFTSAGQAADGPVPMFAVRAGLGVDYRLGGGLSVTLSPVVFARSSGPKNISDKINKIQQFDILVGIGYSL